MSERRCRTITPEIKVINEAEGLVEYVASDEAIDAHREIVSVKGWRFNRFAKNAPFVDSHDYWSLDKLLGQVVSFEIKGGKLVERVKWAIDVPDNELAKLGFAMTKAGYLRAVSVGFIPVRWAYQGGDGFADAVKELKLSAEQAANCRCIYLEQEQIELSACIIGSNPNALAKAYNEGAISEETLAKVGFAGDAEMRFLQQAGDIYEQASPVERGMIHNEVARIYRYRNFSDSSTKAPFAGKPGGAGGASSLDGARLEEIQKRLEGMAAKGPALTA